MTRKRLCRIPRSILYVGLFLLVPVHCGLYPVENAVNIDLQSFNLLSKIPSGRTTSKPYTLGRSVREEIVPTPLTTSGSVTPRSPLREGLELHPEERELHLRSSTRNLSGIGGYQIHAIPIIVGELVSLLTDTHADILSHDTNGSTTLYRFNTTKWSFSVITANATIHYTSIKAVVSRFLKLSAVAGSPTDITSTRVGVLLNDSLPIADVVILPCFDIANASFNHHFKSADYHQHSFENASTVSTEIVTITPHGSTCSYKTINQSAAISPFIHPSLSRAPDLSPRSLETQALAHVAQTVFDLSIRLWRRDDDHIPIEVKVWAFTTVVVVASTQIILAILKKMFLSGYLQNPDSDEDIDRRHGLDSGFYVVGQLVARFVMQITKVDGEGRLLALKAETWRGLVELLLEPLLSMGGMNDTWAMEGDIYEPEDGDEDGGGEEMKWNQCIIGHWGFYVDDYEHSGD